MKANTVQLPSLITAVPSQQKGDRTDGPKLWDKASLNVPKPWPQGSLRWTEKAKSDCTQLGLT